MPELDTHELVEPSQIEREIAEYQHIPVIGVGVLSLPYQSLAPEQFECLLWDLFRSGYETELGHDYTRLMISGADKGRDVWLTLEEVPVGLVQCKRHAAKFTLIDTLKEIIKFLLHADLNRHLLPAPENFTFYLALSCDPSNDVDDFFNTPKFWLQNNQAEVKKQAQTVIQNYKSLRQISIDCAMPLLLERLEKLRYKLIRPHELSRALDIHKDVRDRHFRLPGSVLLGDDHQPDLSENDLEQASRPLICWQKTIENKFIERPELNQLIELVSSDESNSYLLIGASGTGKSSLLSALSERLLDMEFSVLAIKADELDAGINDLTDLARNLKLKGSITNALLRISQSKPLVLIIDQMDAVSEVMDQSSNRFRVLIDLVLSLKDRFKSFKRNGIKPIHIIVSSRPFEASFDTRFTLLDATHIELSLPAKESVEALLADIEIDKSLIPESMYPAIQVPFALNLYVSLITAGESPKNITSKNLLPSWLEKKLTDKEYRKEQLGFLKLLAYDMVNNEVLRRPVSTYQLEYGPIIVRLEAVGIITRFEKNIGFSHQAWLDDFQAQSFKCSTDICEFVYRKQDGLFSRSTILRGFEYLREHNLTEYQSALDELLFGERTRRHIQHLLIDILAVSPKPDFPDAARVRRLIYSDPILAKRVFWKIAVSWSNWRELLTGFIAELMGAVEHAESTVEWLVAEAKQDETHVVSLLSRLWFDKALDNTIFGVLVRATASSPAALELAEQLLSRTGVEESYVNRYVKALLKLGHSKQAWNVLLWWLESVDSETALAHQMYGLDKFVELYPIEFAAFIFPFLVKLIEQAGHDVTSYGSYRRTIRLGYDWDEQSGKGSLLGLIRLALTTAAKVSPSELLALLQPVMAVQIDDIQVMIATALAANAEYFAETIHDFLINDSFRMQLGDGYFTDSTNVGFSVSGSSTMLLIEEAVSFWSTEQIGKIRDAIEEFEAYQLDQDSSAKSRLQFISYNEDYRLKLLARLPPEVLSPRRRRKVSERDVRLEPAIGVRSRGLGLASFVRSPMSVEQMIKAKDRDIIKILNDMTAQSKHYSQRRGGIFGGEIELSRAFGMFAARHPQRAIKLITAEFKPDVHERAASEAIENLAKSEHVSSSELRCLIIELNTRGFDSKEWICGVARAFEALARRDNGLAEQDIELLISYLNTSLDTGHQLEDDSAGTSPNRPLLFGHHNGSRVVPGGNYTVMSAIHQGLLCRPSPDCDTWVDVLSQFLVISKDVETWKCLLLFQMRHLRWAEQKKGNAFIKCLFKENINVFSLPMVATTIWDLSDYMERDILLQIVRYWFSADSHSLSQVAGELTTGLMINGSADLELQAFWQSKFNSDDLNFRCGVIYAASAGWYESGKIRGESHNMIVACLKGNVNGLVTALNALFSFNKQMPNDELTSELIIWLASNLTITAELDQYRLISCLVKLNCSPNLQLYLLDIAQNLVRLKLTEKKGRLSIEQGEELVQLSVTLQRSSGVMKEKAMQLYETLLDAGVYKAEEAAEEALRV